MNKLVFFIYACLNKIIRKTDWFNNQLWGGASKFWNYNHFGLDIVNLGSGAGEHDFSYENMSVKGANWALSPQSLVHDFRILENFFSYIKEGGLVIITVCPFSGLFANYAKSHNFKYYTFLHPATIINFDEDERQRALKIKQDPFRTMPFYCLKSTTKEYYFRLKRRIYNTIHHHSLDIEKSANQIMDGWKKQFCIDDLSLPPSTQHAREIASRRQTLIDIVSFCKERALKPYIVIPVMHESLYRLFPPNFTSNYIDSLLCAIDAPILNYLDDELSKQEEVFSNALFLNKKGAQLFTEKVIRDIEDNLFKENRK